MVSDSMFPSTYYAGNYIAPEKIEGFPLSPRQEEAITRLNPRGMVRDVPIIQKGSSPQIWSETTAFRPQEPRPVSADFPRGQSSPRIPQDYANMVGAKPNKDVKYGNYPELKSSACMNFGTDLGKFKAEVSVHNAQDKPKAVQPVPQAAPMALPRDDIPRDIHGTPLPPAPEGYVWEYGKP